MRINAGRARDRENERRARNHLPPAGQTPELRVGEIGLVSHITAHYGTLTGRYCGSISPRRPSTMLRIARVSVRADARTPCTTTGRKNERRREGEGRSCRSRSS